MGAVSERFSKLTFLSLKLTFSQSKTDISQSGIPPLQSWLSGDP